MRTIIHPDQRTPLDKAWRIIGPVVFVAEMFWLLGLIQIPSEPRSNPPAPDTILGYISLLILAIPCVALAISSAQGIRPWRSGLSAAIGILLAALLILHYF